MKREKNRGKALGMLTVAALAIGLAIAPATALAKGRGGEPDPGRAAARMADKLDLTDEQEAQVEDILAKSFQERKQDREAHREEVETELAKVLTDEQMNEFKDIQEERRGRRDDGDKRGRRHGKGRGDRN